MKILIIEDEHKIAQFIKTGLELENWSVDLTFDGEAGLDLATTEKYNVIILDLMLPKITGEIVCKKLREEFNIHTPILILTAKGTTDDKVSVLNSGADDYLVKPFVFAELVARVRALSRRPENQKNVILRVKDLTLDTINHVVKRGKNILKISKKEYSLLEYLLKNKGVIKSKDEIIKNVWSYDDDVLPNTVEVYINYLRQKIDKSFVTKNPLIHTIRGFGYKVDAHE
ncbi:MAG: response regulator transcription factor [bacterium]